MTPITVMNDEISHRDLKIDKLNRKRKFLAMMYITLKSRNIKLKKY